VRWGKKKEKVARVEIGFPRNRCKDITAEQTACKMAGDKTPGEKTPKCSLQSRLLINAKNYSLVDNSRPEEFAYKRHSEELLIPLVTNN
jgi:hypothetical protein